MTVADDSPLRRPSRRRAAPAYQQVAEDLRRRILAGQMPPGSRLPAESELSDLFQVGRSTVREALRVVASQSLVTTTRGVQGGTFVSQPEPDDLVEYLETAFALLAGAEGAEVEDLIAVRTMLEVPAAGMAALRRTEADLADLRGSLAEGRAGAEHGFTGNRNFHETIVAASGNRLVEVMSRPIFGVLRHRFLRDQAPQAFWKRVAGDHGRILAAVEAGDGERAEREMREHLERLATTYRRIDRRRTAS